MYTVTPKKLVNHKKFVFNPNEKINYHGKREVIQSRLNRRPLREVSPINVPETMGAAALPKKDEAVTKDRSYVTPDNKANGDCICERDQKLVLCQECKESFIGRITKVCGRHPNNVFLMDTKSCLYCRSEKLTEFVLPAEADITQLKNRKLAKVKSL